MPAFRFGVVLAAFILPSIAGAESASPASTEAGPSPTYADLADLSVAAPIAAHVRIRDARRVDPKLSPPPEGKTRVFVQADVVSLIRAPQPLPAQISYLVDLPNQPGGKASKLRKKDEYLAFASPVAGKPAEVRLAAPDAQLPWLAERGDRVRTILKEVTGSDAPPRIVGIGRAFHVAGTLPGEGETQLFLQTADARPISLNVLRRPGQQPSWAVALGEIVDESATTPKPDTMLWYRLACGLPRELPTQSLAEAGPEDAQAIREDYQLVLEGLGPCTRHRERS